MDYPEERDSAVRAETELGPYSEADAPEAVRVDLGALAIPALAGLEIQPQVEADGQTISALTLLVGNSAAQVMPLTQSRSGGLWDELRAELRENLESQGATVNELTGRWGRELRALLPETLEDGRQAFTPVRVVGISGDRWLLRIVFQGRAAADEGESIEDVIAQVVVRRGTDPRPPGDILPISLPSEAQE